MFKKKKTLTDRPFIYIYKQQACDRRGVENKANNSKMHGMFPVAHEVFSANALLAHH